jgi:hypothetical protein
MPWHRQEVRDMGAKPNAAGDQKPISRLEQGQLHDFLEAIFPQDALGYVELEVWLDRARVFVPVDDRDAIIRFILRHQDKDLLYGVSTRKESGDLTLGNRRDLWSMFSVVNFRGTPEAKARRLLEQFQLKPSCVVATGTGLDLYWFLRNPISGWALKGEDLSRKIRALARRLGGDVILEMSSHMLRVPFSVNSRVEAPGVNAWRVPPPRVAIELLRPERVYDLEEFDSHMSAPLGKRKSRPPR